MDVCSTSNNGYKTADGDGKRTVDHFFFIAAAVFTMEWMLRA